MIRLIISLHRHPDRTEADFQRAWAHEHAQAARGLPGLRSYALRGPGPDPCKEGDICDGVAELWFAGPNELRTALMSPVGRAFLSAIAADLDPRRFTLAVETVPPGAEVL